MDCESIFLKKKKTRDTDTITSLHKNHPGLRTAMMTAPDLSHRDLAVTICVSEGTNRAKA